jgi:hypothetical protein
MRFCFRSEGGGGGEGGAVFGGGGWGIGDKCRRVCFSTTVAFVSFCDCFSTTSPVLPTGRTPEGSAFGVVVVVGAVVVVAFGRRFSSFSFSAICSAIFAATAASRSALGAAAAAAAASL